ncbi:MAG: ADP-glyceromanno-heptose 6-epimerase [Bacteroidales bacterium]|nr:ADP-glyceromanno-heptose 6-epimerase [Bacteroidales bacterium]
MIVVTGAAGFIASNLVARLNELGREDVVLVDDFSKEAKRNNWEQKRYVERVDRTTFADWFRKHASEVEVVFHLGARTDTTEFDWNVFLQLNLHYTQEVWRMCTEAQVPVVYASSAATYGAGECGYSDNHDVVERLQPLNPYGRSKNDFDKWALQQETQPPFWAGVKFFNVYGPNEYHKGRMASVVMHTYNSICERGYMNLFRSHRSDYADGMQLRDFVYVKDVVEAMLFLVHRKPASGLYNIGTGRAQSFLDLARATFAALGKESDIRFVDMPEDIRDKYQYYTQAEMGKLRSAGYNEPFRDLQSGVEDYVKNYLCGHRFA